MRLCLWKIYNDQWKNKPNSLKKCLGTLSWSEGGECGGLENKVRVHRKNIWCTGIGRGGWCWSDWNFIKIFIRSLVMILRSVGSVFAIKRRAGAVVPKRAIWISITGLHFCPKRSLTMWLSTSFVTSESSTIQASFGTWSLSRYRTMPKSEPSWKRKDCVWANQTGNVSILEIWEKIE